MGSDREMRKQDKQIESLQKDIELWKKKVIKLNEAVTELQEKVKEMEINVPKVKTKKTKMKLKVLVCLPPSWCYPTPCYKSQTPNYEYNQLPDEYETLIRLQPGYRTSHEDVRGERSLLERSIEYKQDD